ncbi:VgrG-related protein [Streptomyces sp. RPT161]|uniref:VgrG-related protein n=1 Tax=Streptomyces sp. RPT161 TaxID=3015993 RepID=UPI0022B87D89|nr:VgrG-related protein [Streptomyces sp. RPT161]
MSETPYTEVLQVTLDGRPLTSALASLLVEGWVDASVNVPAAFQLTFQDPHHQVLAALGVRIGSRAVLRGLADGKDSGKPLLTGEVTALETDFDGAGAFTVVRGLDFGHRLLRGRRVAGYREMTASDIARRIAAQHGLTVGRVDSTATVYQLVTQPGVSDWEFLNRLADENDAEVVFTDQGEFQFVQPKPASGAPAPSTPAKSSPYVVEKGRNLIRCRVGVTASDQVTNVQVRGWDVHAKRPLTARVSAADSDELKIGLTPGSAAAPFGTAELLGTDVPYDTQSEVEHAADALAADTAAAFAELEAELRGDPWLRPGVPVALNGMGVPFEGRYTATAVRHHFSAGTGYRTWLTVSGRQHRTLYGLASGSGSGAALEQRLSGVVIGTVTDVKDPLEQGRVKLNFPWLSDDYVSDWARTVQFGGVRGGGVISPEVGDEVLVAFDRGALDHPYVLGGLYNGRDKPSPHDVPLTDGTSGRVNRRSLVSRSGNRLELLDAPVSPRGVRLRTGDESMTVHLDQTGTAITIRSDGEVSITGTRAVSVTSQGPLTLRGAVVSISSESELSFSAVEVNTAATAVTTEATEVNTTAASVSTEATTVSMEGVVTANGAPVV